MVLELPTTFPMSSPTSAPAHVLGRTEPRLWTPPLRELTPETSYGYDVIDFARDVLNHPLDPWQEWLVIHAGELLPDGRPRFRKVLVMVARQNGKTELLVVLAAYWMFVEAVPLILGTAQKLAYAQESWRKMVTLVERTRALNTLRNVRKWTSKAMGAGSEECFTLEGSRYKIAASNESGGRSLTIHRLILDELRMHWDWRAWGAAVPAGNAVADFQVWAISNAGTDQSLVLNTLRDGAVKHLETGEGDDQLGLFEWSATLGASPLDVDALAQANPNLGRRIDLQNLLGDARRAVQNGGDDLTQFLTESMCVRVPSFDAAINPARWDECFVEGDLQNLKSRWAWCVDLSVDRQHASLVAAAVMEDGRVRVQVLKSWKGEKAAAQLRRELPASIAKHRPQVVGWMPNGPAAALAADLKDRKTVRGWPPPGVTVAEIGAEVAAVCMGLAEQVDAGQIVHGNDPLLNDHVKGASKLISGDVWKFSRKGEGHCDAAYAAAGAVHLARTLPPPVGKPRIVLAT